MSELTEEGLYVDAASSIALYSGGRIDPLNPVVEDIHIKDIAHSLSQQCRWTGHTTRFYSVAEHCVHVSHQLTSLALEGLLHDASEAYLSDLARPIKKAEGLGEEYEHVERGLERVIAKRFDLTYPWKPAVRVADEQMLWREAKQLVPHLGEKMPEPQETTPYAQCWTPERAEEEFLKVFYSLTTRSVTSEEDDWVYSEETIKRTTLTPVALTRDWPSGSDDIGDIRIFETGATRNVDAAKPDYEAFLSPLVIEEFGRYMNDNRVQADGTVRDGDNWQKGIPLDSYVKSGFRHFMSWWLLHRKHPTNETLKDALCALIFNAQGYLHEVLKAEAQHEEQAA